MLPDLSPHLHTDECNKLISELRSCHSENKFLKYVGICNDLDRAVWKCMKAERIQRRTNNRIQGEKKRQEYYQKLKEGYRWDKDT